MKPPEIAKVVPRVGGFCEYHGQVTSFDGSAK